MRVALFGWYGFGNFGDDLMAAMFGKFLQHLGADVIVYDLDRSEAWDLGLETTDDVEGLISRSDAFVYGGGGLFLQDSSRSLASRIRDRMGVARRLHAAEQIRSFVRDRKTLGNKLGRWQTATLAAAELCQRQKVPVCLISVGGAGERTAPKPWSEALLRAASCITVRNKEDLAIASCARAPVDYYPDVVLQTDRFFPRVPPESGVAKKIIGIDMAHPESPLAAKALNEVITRVARQRSDLEFVSVDTAKGGYPMQSLFTARSELSGCAETYQCPSVTIATRYISQLSMIVSCRLHFGMAGLSYGVPFVSFSGHKKTGLFFHAAGKDELFLKNTGGDLRTLNDILMAREFTELWPAHEVQALKAASKKHLDRLQRFVDGVERVLKGT